MSGARNPSPIGTGISATANTSLERITGGDAFCLLVPMPVLGSLADYDLSVGTSGKGMLPSCAVRIVEDGQAGDTAAEANRKFFMPGLNLTRIQSLTDGVTTAAYIIYAGANRSCQMILRSPTRQVREDISFSEIPTRPGSYAATCKVYSAYAKSVLLKDGRDTKRPK
jgi:hypothetical protein